MSKKKVSIGGISYDEIEELGRGGFGRVIKVLNKLNNKFYAAKEISIKGKTKDEIEKYQKEADILSKFNCKNIVKYYNSSKKNENFYILMEYCAGQNLKDYIEINKNNNSLIEENILYNIIIQICSGIKEIHKMKIIHRDLKPENIFMNENMNIKIGDFGISKQLRINKDYTFTKNKAGSEDYMAPEIKHKGIYNEKSDMWSLGCIIYELFNLRIYSKDKDYNEIKILDSDIYNNKWQKIINSLLQIDYNKRMNINELYNLLKEEKIQILGNEKNSTNINNKNIIIGEIYINKDNINQKHRIINSFENIKIDFDWIEEENESEYLNENEIIENIEIKIDGKVIKFTYYYEFEKEGRHVIEYSFKNNLTKTDYMFYRCFSLTNLNLSYFNTQNVINMSHMFEFCISLTNLNLSNFNTQNVTNMSSIFKYCNSLTKNNIITNDIKILTKSNN